MDTRRPGQEPNAATHCSYLLRLWRSGEDGGWRASLQSIQTGERHMFADMESLFAFLVEQRCPSPEVIRHNQP
jgi:hypothetical protein